MNRVLYALVVLLCFELGVFLLLLPWCGIGEHNYFLSRFPGLFGVMLNPAVPGAELLALAGEAVAEAKGHSRVVINDRLDAAMAARAGGVHLGETSLPLT